MHPESDRRKGAQLSRPRRHGPPPEASKTIVKIDSNGHTDYPVRWSVRPRRRTNHVEADRALGVSHVCGKRRLSAPSVVRGTFAA